MKPTVKHPILKRLFKFTLATLGVLALIVAILGVMLYRNLGGLPDESRFAHLSYYKNGQKNQQLLKKPKNKQCFKAIHAKIKNTRQDLIYKFTTQPVKDNAPVRKAEQVCQ